MKSTKAIFSILVLMVLMVSILGPGDVARADTQVEPCRPFLTAGTPYFISGEVHANNFVFCQDGSNSVVTFFVTIKVFRQSDHAWLFDTVTKSETCAAPCSYDYDPNFSYNSAYSYYTWARVSVYGTGETDVDESDWFNY